MPSRKRPPQAALAVAACCAITTGWRGNVGTTDVPSSSVAGVAPREAERHDRVEAEAGAEEHAVQSGRLAPDRKIGRGPDAAGFREDGRHLHWSRSSRLSLSAQRAARAPLASLAHADDQGVARGPLGVHMAAGDAPPVGRPHEVVLVGAAGDEEVAARRGRPCGAWPARTTSPCAASPSTVTRMLVMRCWVTCPQARSACPSAAARTRRTAAAARR